MKNTEQKGGGLARQGEGLRDPGRGWRPRGTGRETRLGQGGGRRAALVRSRPPWLGAGSSGRSTRLLRRERGAGLRAEATGPGGRAAATLSLRAAPDPNPPPGPRASAAKQNKLVPVSCCATQSRGSRPKGRRRWPAAREPERGDRRRALPGPSWGCGAAAARRSRRARVLTLGSPVASCLPNSPNKTGARPARPETTFPKAPPSRYPTESPLG